MGVTAGLGRGSPILEPEIEEISHSPLGELLWSAPGLEGSRGRGRARQIVKDLCLVKDRYNLIDNILYIEVI